MSTRWSLGVLIGLPVLAVIVIALAMAGILVLRQRGRVDRSDRSLVLTLGWGLLALAATVVIVAATPLGYYPYGAEYHQWRPVTGTVAQVSSRLIPAGDKTVQQRFVVLLQGTGRQYGCDDTRCSLVKPGDQISLYCKREWQYASVSGFGCNFAGVRRG